MVLPVGVKFFRSGDVGAPTFKSNEKGTLMQLMYACLVSGYNVNTVDTITRADSVVTVEVSAGHGFEVEQVIQINGADQSEYNGDHRVLSATATVFTFEITGTPDTPATGTVDCRLAPAGWERPFVDAAGERAVFHRPALDATEFDLCFDDHLPSTRRAAVYGVKNASGVGIGEDHFPRDAGANAQFYLYKNTGDNQYPAWCLVADDKMVYFIWDTRRNTTEWGHFAFGDIISHISGDQGHCVISGEWHATYDYYLSQFFSSGIDPQQAKKEDTTWRGGACYATDIYGLRPTERCLGAVFPTPNPSAGRGHVHGPIPPGAGGTSFPSPVTGGMVLFPMYSVSGSADTSVVRGQIPGMYSPYHDHPMPNRTLIEGRGPFTGRKFLSMNMRGGRAYLQAEDIGPSDTGQALVDIYGPWRA